MSVRLTEAQAGAVASRAKLRVIVAGAGTGKTATLVELIADLVLERGREPECVSAVSFTRNAAGEFRERVEARLGARAAGINFGTSHSLALRIVRGAALDLRLPENFIVYDEQDEADIVREIATSAKLAQKAVRAAVQEARRPTGASVDAKAVAAAERYEAKLRTAGAIDFDSILLLAVRALRELPAVRAKWSWHARYLIVDEFQDTAADEVALYDALGPMERVVVGDPNQNLYTFRGTSNQFLLDLVSAPGASVHYLLQSFRSGPAIVNAADRLIGHNPGAGDGHLKPREDIEASAVALPAWALVGEDGARAWWRNIADSLRHGCTIGVLARTNELADQFRAAIEAAGVMAASLTNDRSFYSEREVRAFHAILRARRNPHDLISTGLILDELLGLTEEVRHRARKDANDTDRSILDVLRWDGLAVDSDLGVIAAWARDQLATRYEEQGRTSRASNVRHAFDRVERRRAAEPGLSLEGFLDWLGTREVVAMLRERAVSGPAIDVGTIHAAKGLEWDIVVVVGVEDGVLPHKKADIEEERRLMYVAMTRARLQLVLVAPPSGAQFVTESGLAFCEVAPVLPQGAEDVPW